MIVSGACEQATSVEAGPQCPVASFLRRGGVQVTPKRRVVAEVLLAARDRHLSAQAVHRSAVTAGHTVSLATVYNALNEFVRAGLIRELCVVGDMRIFDTDTRDHAHFLDVERGEIRDVEGRVRVSGVSSLPPGMRVGHIEVTIALVPNTGGASEQGCGQVCVALDDLAHAVRLQLTGV